MLFPTVATGADHTENDSQKPARTGGDMIKRIHHIISVFCPELPLLVALLAGLWVANSVTI